MLVRVSVEEMGAVAGEDGGLSVKGEGKGDGPGVKVMKTV